MKKKSCDAIEHNNRVKEAFESKEFKEAFRKQVERDTWGNGLPMVYMNDDGWMVHHWSDGRIDMIKKLK
jgi:hypothetical protein